MRSAIAIVPIACALVAALTAHAGGAVLLDGAETAPLIVVGTVRDPEALDDIAWRAHLEIETVLRGDRAAGQSIAIAWEERFPDRPRRFDAGSRVLVALEPLPGWSIWRTRLRGRETLGVARRGEAFLRDPTPETVESLADYLRLSEAARAGAPGAGALIALARRAQPPLALSALDRLAERPDLGTSLDAADVAALGNLISDPEAPVPLRTRALEVAGRGRVSPLETAVAEAARPGSPVASGAVDALGRLRGGFDAAALAGWLSRREPGVRAMAVRHARASVDPDPARAALADDPEARVRAEAARSLGRRRGMAAFDALARALDDPDPEVRGAAADALGSLGAPVVPPLVDRVRDTDLDGARAALVALARAGAPGRQALAGLAAGHADEQVRAFAAFLLGRPPARH